MNERLTDDGSGERPRRDAAYIGPVLDSHNRGLAEFFRESWDGDSDEESVGVWRSREAAENPVQPGTEPPKWVFAKGERILGYLGSIPELFWVRGRTFPAYWLKGFWVHPEFRSGPVGFEVLKAAVATLDATAVSTVAAEARRLFDSQGLEDLGVLFNRIKVLNPSRLLSRVDPDSALEGLPGFVRRAVRLLQATRLSGLAGSCVGLASKVLVGFRGRAPGLESRVGWDALSEEALDVLWAEARTAIDAAPVRNGLLTRWRYEKPGHYEAVSLWRGGSLRGWAVVKRPSEATKGRLRGLSVASLSDIFFVPGEPSVGRSVVRAAERLAVRFDADGLLCSGTSPILEEQLGRRGFVAIPGNVHFMARGSDDRSFSVPAEGWWLTRGDAQSDGSF